MTQINVKTIASEKEIEGRISASNAFRNCPIPDTEVLANAGIFQKRQELTKQLFFNKTASFELLTARSSS